MARSSDRVLLFDSIQIAPYAGHFSSIFICQLSMIDPSEPKQEIETDLERSHAMNEHIQGNVLGIE
jgi:hypothetical protein